MPSAIVKFHKQTHAWLNGVFAKAILVKNGAEGTVDYAAARDACAQIRNSAYRDHVSRTAPLAILSRRILCEATWPERWKTHYLMPIYKRDSFY